MPLRELGALLRVGPFSPRGLQILFWIGVLYAVQRFVRRRIAALASDEDENED